METKKKRYQIAFDVSKDLHTEVKILAAKRNISMNLWIARAIQERILKDKKYEQSPSD